MGTAYASGAVRPLEAASATPRQVRTPPPPGSRPRTSLAGIAEIFGGACIFVVATYSAWHLRLTLPSVSFVYFLMIVLAAVRWGFWEATVATVAAVACLDYFFTPPLFSFRVTGSANWIALGAFEFAGLVVSRLSTRAQEQARIATQERNNMARLYELSRSILLLDSHQAPGPQIATFIHKALEVDSVALYDPLLARADEAGQSSPSLRDAVRETWIRDTNQDASEEQPDSHTWSRILRLGTKGIGAIVLRGADLNPLVVDAAASIAAVALERSRALEKETRAEAARQSDQLRTAVLDALAHAFKTPLTAIRAASSGLLETGSLGSSETELVTIIDDESDRLNDLATRLLQTARLEGATVPVRREHRRVTDVIDQTLGTLIKDPAGPQEINGHRIDVRVSGLDAMVYGNCELIVTALTQFIDNAVKYSDAGSPISISADVTPVEAIFSVHNFGPIIEPEERERVFERFYRSRGTEHRAPGTGLGLSITRKVAEAHQGRAWVKSNEKEGTTFFLALSGAAAGRN